GGMALALTVAGLYLSSLSTTGVRALLSAWPALFAAGWFIDLLVERLGPPTAAVMNRLLRLPVPLDSPVNPIDGRLLDNIGVAVTAGVLLLVLRFALTNHGAADGPPRRIAGQALWIAAAITLSIVIVGAL